MLPMSLTQPIDQFSKSTRTNKSLPSDTRWHKMIRIIKKPSLVNYATTLWSHVLNYWALSLSLSLSLEIVFSVRQNSSDKTERKSLENNSLPVIDKSLYADMFFDTYDVVFGSQRIQDARNKDKHYLYRSSRTTFCGVTTRTMYQFFLAHQ